MLGVKSRAVLECLRKNGRKNRLDIEMMLSMGQLTRTLTRLVGLQYIYLSSNGAQGSSLYSITRQGCIALGESFELPTPQQVKFCNATTTGNYIPGIHNTSRIGVART